jgi:hypothetical protein
MSIPLDSLAATATKVAELHSAHHSASASLADKEAALLEHIVSLVRPAIGALSSRIVVSSRTTWPDNTGTATKIMRGSVKGVRVLGDGPKEDHPRANDGAYGGEDLWLLSDGTWSRVRYSGTWSRWQGATITWRGETSSLSPQEVVEKYSVEDIAESLLSSLTKQRDGNLERRTKTMARRIETIDAMLRLMDLA